MGNKQINIILIAFCLVMVGGLTTGCGVLPSTSGSKYPADISGYVAIAEKVKALTAIPVPPNRDSDIFWIVDVSVKNKAYNDPVEANLETGYEGWEIIADDKVYRPRTTGMNEPVSIALGQTGQVMLYFVVPRNLQVGNAQICYRGQEPYSYGKLTGGDKVAAYDWGSKTVVPETQEDERYEQYFVKKEVTGHKKVGRIGNIDITEPVYKDIYMKLETVGSWEKKTSGAPTPHFGLDGQLTGHYRLIEFNTSKAPWVVNWSYQPRAYTVLDPIDSYAYVHIVIYKKADYDEYSWDPSRLTFLDVGENRGISEKGVHCTVVDEAGHYVMKLWIETSSLDAEDIVDWWVKVGVE